MLTPEYIRNMTDRAEQNASKLHNYVLMEIIKRLVARMDKGQMYLTSTDKFQIEALQESGFLMADIQKILADFLKVEQKEVIELMQEAGIESMKWDNKIFMQAGLMEEVDAKLMAAKLIQSPYYLRVLERNYNVINNDLTNFTRTVAYQCNNTFVTACDTAYMKVMSGATSYTQAYMEAIEELANNGISLGRDSVEAATLRCIRTGVNQTCADITTKRMDEVGCDLVLVSAHLGARPTHYEWQGKVYSRTGKKYPDFVTSTGYGSAEGLCGVNCRHSFSPYVEGMENPFEKFDKAENDERYQNEQKQRAMERGIRKQKQKCIALREAIDNTKDEQAKFELTLKYQQACNTLKGRNIAYSDFSKEKGMRPLEERLKVAEWTREDTRRSLAAARQYEKAKDVAKDTTTTNIPNINETTFKKYDHYS